MQWVIYDWAGNRVFPNVFETFEDAWEFIRERFPEEEDWQEFYVESLPTDVNGKKH